MPSPPGEYVFRVPLGLNGTPPGRVASEDLVHPTNQANFPPSIKTCGSCLAVPRGGRLPQGRIHRSRRHDPSTLTKPRTPPTASSQNARIDSSPLGKPDARQCHPRINFPRIFADVFPHNPHIDKQFRFWGPEISRNRSGQSYLEKFAQPGDCRRKVLQGTIFPLSYGILKDSQIRQNL